MSEDQWERIPLDLGSGISDALEEGYSPSEILEYVSGYLERNSV